MDLSNLPVPESGFFVTHFFDRKGDEFLTDPLDNHGEEMRCYMHDPDGYLIEVGQNSPDTIEPFKKYAG